MKKCPICNNDILNDAELCHSCLKNRYENDTEFRIENDASKFGCLKSDATALIVLIVLSLFFVIGLLFWGIILIVIGSDVQETTLLGVGILMIVGGLALIGVAIKLVAMRSKTKYLMKNGIVLKNLKFKTTKRTPAFTYALIEHIDGEGNPCVFKGILPTNVVRDKDICDVAVDPKNYKKYLIRYNIF